MGRLAGRRTRTLANVTTMAGTAQAVPLPDASVDVVHVVRDGVPVEAQDRREIGAELDRVIRRIWED